VGISRAQLTLSVFETTEKMATYVCRLVTVRGPEVRPLNDLAGFGEKAGFRVVRSSKHPLPDPHVPGEKGH